MKEMTIENGEDRRPVSDTDDCDAMEDESDDVTDVVFVGWVR